MSAWQQIEDAEPDFAARVKRLFEARKHKAIATLRADGSPRISGIESQFTAGEFTMGMMPGSVKAADLLRDNRMAIQVTAEDPDETDPSSWPGDAKIAGRALPHGGPSDSQQDAVWFRVDIAEIVLTKVGTPADHLLIESWREGRGVRRIERR